MQCRTAGGRRDGPFGGNLAEYRAMTLRPGTIAATAAFL
jgi:hypothetical protein